MIKQLVQDGKAPMTLVEIQEYFDALLIEQPIKVHLNNLQIPDNLVEFVQNWKLIQSIYGALRSISIHDTYRICQICFPGTSFADVLRIYKEAQGKGLVGMICGGIQRRILRINCRGWELFDYLDTNKPDDYGHTFNSLFALI